MPVRATCPACGVALFTPADGSCPDAMVERHQRFGLCLPRVGAQVDRRAVIEEDGREAGRAGRGLLA